MMLQRTIPSSGERLPAVGLGTWARFDAGASATARDPLLRVLENMAALGGKLIDSSPMYGSAEEVVGDLTAASGLADRFFYATKVWTSGAENGIRQMEASRQKMRREVIDLMQIHNLVDWRTQLKTLRAWKDAGKVRYIGITHYTVSAHAQLEQIIRSEPVDFVQFNYSIRVRDAERSLLGAARDNGVAVIVNEPLEKGFLFKSVKGIPLPAWASEYDIGSWGAFFLKYILAHPAVTCVIPATADPAHVADNMKAGYGRLPDENARKKMADLVSTF